MSDNASPITYRIVVIRGDGIGPELVAAAMQVLDAAQQALGTFRLEVDYREAGAGFYAKRGVSLTPGTMAAIKGAHATMKGPVGMPEVRLPDGTEAGTLGGVLRTGLDTYVIMENFLGDILSDLGGATVGGIGLCPSGNIGDQYAYFEPIHGSAPDIAGQDKANPVSQVLTAALMMEHVGEFAAANLIRRAVATALGVGRLVLGVHGQPEGGTRRAGETLAAVVSELASARPR